MLIMFDVCTPQCRYDNVPVIGGGELGKQHTVEGLRFHVGFARVGTFNVSSLSRNHFVET